MNLPNTELHLQEMLEKAFHTDDVIAFAEWLGEESANPAQRHPSDEHLSIFEKCCKTRGYAAFIDECIKWAHRVNMISQLNSVNDHWCMSPVNFAVESEDTNNIKVLLECPAFNVDHSVNSMTALHKVIAEMNILNFHKSLEFIKTLINCQADVNIPNELGVPPILILIRNTELSSKQKQEVVAYIIGNAIVDLDLYESDECRQAIAEMCPEVRLPADIQQDDRHWNVAKLFDALRKADEEDVFRFGFLAFKRGKSEDELNTALREKIADKSMLTMAIAEGMKRAVELLLRAGADVHDFCTTSNDPIRTACRKGRYEILAMLLRAPGADVNRSAVLFDVIYDPSRMRNIAKFDRCFDLLINEKDIDLDKRDSFGGTALHIAVAYKHTYVINKLLAKGAFIGSSDQFGTVAIENMNPKLLESNLDNCIRAHHTNTNVEISFDYTILKPTEYNTEPGPFDEMSPIRHIAKTKELRHLIKHPLIASFLHLKWKQTSNIFLLDIFLFSIFSLAIISYIFWFAGHGTSSFMRESLYTISVVFTVLGYVRGVLEFSMCPREFVRGFVNWCELAMWIMCTVILSRVHLDGPTQQTVSVVTILMVCSKQFLLVGALPILSVATQFHMFQTTFLKTVENIRIYMVMFFALALCLATLLANTKQTADMPALTRISYVIVVGLMYLLVGCMIYVLAGLSIDNIEETKLNSEIKFYVQRADALDKHEQHSLLSDDNKKWYHLIQNIIFAGETSLFPSIIPKTNIYSSLDPRITKCATAVVNRRVKDNKREETEAIVHEDRFGEIEKNMKTIQDQLHAVLARM